MLEIGGVEDAGGEDDDLRVLDAGRGDFGHGVVQAQAVLVDAADPQAGHQVGHHAQAHVAVFDDVGDAGGGAGVVFEDAEGAGFVADDVGAADMDVGVERHIEADHRLAVAGVFQHQFGGDDLVGEDFAFVVDVAQEHVERADTLDDAGFDLGPLGRGDDAGDEVEGQDAVDGGGIGIDGEGDAAFEQVAFGVGGAAAQAFDRQGGEAGHQQRQSGVLGLAGAQHLTEERTGIVTLHCAVRLQQGLHLALHLSLARTTRRHPRLHFAMRHDRRKPGGGKGFSGVVGQARPKPHAMGSVGCHPLGSGLPDRGY